MPSTEWRWQAKEVWHLRNPERVEVALSPPARISADESGVLLRLAETGAGITRLSATIVRPAIDEDRLVHVMPDWAAGTITTTLLSPHKRGQLPAVRVFIDLVTAPAQTAA